MGSRPSAQRKGIIVAHLPDSRSYGRRSRNRKKPIPLNAVEYATKNVVFWQSSPISGRFDASKYPLLIKPLICLDNIFRKVMVVLGPTQSVKSVFLQIATAYRLDIKRKSTLCVAQSDPDAREFATIKLNPFMERIPSLANTAKKGRYSITLSHWLWPTHEMIVSGPGENAQQSKSVCYVHTDEAHLWNVLYPGALEALDDRMGLRWDRHALHVTTAPDAGTSIDKLFKQGRMNEWNIRCPDCNQLFEPLWEDNSKDKYNGHRVFIADGPMETAPLDSIRMRCPHCDKRDLIDHPILRKEMDEGADYIPSNPTADKQNESFRWNAFGPRWKAWRDLLAIYQTAIASAKLGDLAPYENWIKKQLVQTWTGDFPLLGSNGGGRDYDRASIVRRPESLRVCSFDVQEGIGNEGWHLWGQVDEFDLGGASRRIDYRKLASWSDARAFQQEHGVDDKHTGCDFGHRAREVFGRCAEYHWLALKSGDEEGFAHPITDAKGNVIYTQLPYSQTRPENPMAGKSALTSIAQQSRKVIRFTNGRVPPGWCISRLWSKPSMYPIFYALKSGQAGREYGIASDMPKEYEDQLHSYIPRDDMDRKTGSVRKVIWVQTRKHDHSFQTSAQNLILAVIAGYYPLDMKPAAETAA